MANIDGTQLEFQPFDQTDVLKMATVSYAINPISRVIASSNALTEQYLTQVTVQEYIHNLYLIAMLRAPSTQEMQDAVTALTLGCSTGTILDSTKILIDDLFNSAFYISRSRTNDQYVDDLIRGVLGRTPTEHPLWTNVLGAILGEDGAWIKTASSTFGNSGATASLTIPDSTPGHLKIVAGTPGWIVAGFSYAPDPRSEADFEYAVFLNQENTVAGVVIGGVFFGVFLGGGVLGSMVGGRGIGYTPGDEFGIFTDGSDVTFTKNASLVYTSTVPVSDDIHVGITARDQGASILSSVMSPAPAGDGTFYVDALNATTLTRQQVRDAFNYGEEHEIRVSSFCKRVRVTTGQIWPRGA